jgi:hypothetical protein
MAGLFICIAIGMIAVFWLVSLACERELRREAEETADSWQRKKAA